MRMKKKRIILLAAACALALFLLCGGRLVKAALQPLLSPAPITADQASAPAQVTLRKGDMVVFGAYRGEPILWQVLRIESGRPLMWSSRILCFKAFDAAGAAAGFHEGPDHTAQGANGWADSTLRQWLNSAERAVPWSHCPPNAQNVLDGMNPYAEEAGFLTGFQAAERALLAERNGDLVFLLSQKELSRWVPIAERAKKLTRTASMLDQSAYLNLPMSPEWYWTSSPAGSTRTGVATVTTSGGFYKDPAYDGHTGVCPAVLLNSVSVSARGDGSAKKPYLIRGAAA